MKIVDQWWKKWSVQLLIVANVVANLSVFLPEAKEYLSEEWVRYAFMAILVARVIKQEAANQSEQ